MTHQNPIEHESPIPAAGSLPQLLHLLQGAGEPCLADVGITRLDGARLDMLHRLARQQANACMECMDVVLHLLEDVLGSTVHAPPRADQAVQQLQRALVEFRRWNDLADNAAYYRDHPAIHARIARALD